MNILDEIGITPNIKEVTYSWLPYWAYNKQEIKDIQNMSIRYDRFGYTVKEEIKSSGLFNKGL